MAIPPLVLSFFARWSDCACFSGCLLRVSSFLVFGRLAPSLQPAASRHGPVDQHQAVWRLPQNPRGLSHQDLFRRLWSGSATYTNKQNNTHGKEEEEWKKVEQEEVKRRKQEQEQEQEGRISLACLLTSDFFVIAVSVIAAVLMVILFMSELRFFLTTEVRSHQFSSCTPGLDSFSFLPARLDLTTRSWSSSCTPGLDSRCFGFQTQPELFVDTSRNEKMRINVEMVFPQMPCACEFSVLVLVLLVLVGLLLGLLAVFFFLLSSSSSSSSSSCWPCL
jgi:hypothetical protein